jgi:hypothetical protein
MKDPRIGRDEWESDADPFWKPAKGSETAQKA